MLTDKEIEEMYPLDFEDEESNKRQLEHQKAAKWARDKACEWVPVERELPDKSGDYLVVWHCDLTDRKEVDISVFHAHDKEWEAPDVTHWQPLPDKTKSE